MQKTILLLGMLLFSSFSVPETIERGKSKGAAEVYAASDICQTTFYNMSSDSRSNLAPTNAFKIDKVMVGNEERERITLRNTIKLLKEKWTIGVTTNDKFVEGKKIGIVKIGISGMHDSAIELYEYDLSKAPTDNFNKSFATLFKVTEVGMAPAQPMYTYQFLGSTHVSGNGAMYLRSFELVVPLCSMKIPFIIHGNFQFSAEIPNGRPIDSVFKHQTINCGFYQPTDKGPSYANGGHFKLNLNYDSPALSSETLKSLLTAYDVDTDALCDVFEDLNEYRGHEKEILKKMSVQFHASDSNPFGEPTNNSIFTIDITVNDLVKPKLQLATGKTLRCGYSHLLNVNDVLAYFSTTDNYLVAQPVLKLVNEDAIVAMQTQKVGSFPLKLSSTDISNNQTIGDYTFIRYDDVAPVIKTAKVINTPRLEKLTQQAIINQATITDEIDLNPIVTITDDSYSANAGSVGEYYVTLRAEDASSNVTTEMIAIRVTDKEGPVWYVDEQKITTFSNGKIDNQTILQALIDSKVVPSKSYPTIEIISGDYEESYEEIGLHKILFRLIDSEGIENIIPVEIDVKEPLTERKTLGFWAKIGLWFKNMWHEITNFFTNLF